MNAWLFSKGPPHHDKNSVCFLGGLLCVTLRPDLKGVSMSGSMEAPAHLSQAVSPENLDRLTEFFRLDVSRKLDPSKRGELGQFFTPLATARVMASMVTTIKTR